jgi:hypothetical protein
MKIIYGITTLFIIIMMFIPIVSANYIPGEIIDTQTKHPTDYLSIYPGWSKYPNSGTWQEKIEANDSETANCTGTDQYFWTDNYDFADRYSGTYKITVDVFFIAKSNATSTVWIRLWSNDYLAWIHRTWTINNPVYQNYSTSISWDIETNLNWTIPNINDYMTVLVVTCAGEFVLNELGITLTVTQYESATELSPIFMYLIGMIILLIINLIGYTKIPILCVFGIIGTMILAIPTVNAFDDYYMIAIILLIINIGLPVMGLAKVGHND